MNRPLWIAALVLTLAGCPSQDSSSPTPAQNASLGPIEILSVGTLVYRIEADAKGTQISDKDGVLYSVETEGPKRVVKDPAGKVLAILNRTDDSIEINDAAGKSRFVVTLVAMVNYHCKTSGGDVFCKIKTLTDSVIAEDAAGARAFSVTLYDGKPSLRDANDSTIYFAREATAPLPFAALGLKDLSTPEQLGLFVVLQGE